MQEIFRATMAYLTFTFLWSGWLCAQPISSGQRVDDQLLNSYILKEVNKHRKKAKVAPLYNDDRLKPAADDHAAYMARRNKLTHFQNTREKKTPKNRVDFYGEQFSTVGENCQQTYLQIQGKHDIKSYAELAEVLVTGWRNSPPHYANMISEDFTTTYTSIHVGTDGKIYACQLFGSDAYSNSYRDSLLLYDYLPANAKRCKRCEKKQLHGSIELTDDSTIMFVGIAPLFKSKHLKRRLRMNYWSFGIAADIVLREQYDCDTNIVFNGKTGVRGIPLEPVFKKDFKEGENVFFWKFIRIELGKVPDWVDQEFEVNVTLINRRRTCAPVIYENIPVGFEVDVEVNLYLDSLRRFYRVMENDTNYFRVNFQKSESAVGDSVFKTLDDYVRGHLDEIKMVNINGYSSIEGSTQTNIALYNQRAQAITSRLIELGVDSSLVSVNARENFGDFRRSLAETNWSNWASLSDEELKKRINYPGTADELEFLLKDQRYADVVIITERQEQRPYTKELIYDELKREAENGNIARCKNLQAMEYAFAAQGIISLDEIRSFSYPATRQNIDLLHDRCLMIYRLDSLNPDARNEFRDTLIGLQKLDPKDKRINTSLAIFSYESHREDGMAASKKYLDTLLALQNIDKTIKARMILNTAARHDWIRYFYLGTRVSKTKKYVYDDVLQYIDDAKLDLSETFEIATYLSTFEQYDQAYDLTRKLVVKSKSKEEVVFFLKLIYYLHESLPSKTVVNYFKRIAKAKGDEFCTYFNSPYLNFQILDDPEIREIYCEACND